MGGGGLWRCGKHTILLFSMVRLGAFFAFAICFLFSAIANISGVGEMHCEISLIYFSDAVP